MSSNAPSHALTEIDASLATLKRKRAEIIQEMVENAREAADARIAHSRPETLAALWKILPPGWELVEEATRIADEYSRDVTTKIHKAESDCTDPCPWTTRRVVWKCADGKTVDYTKTPIAELTRLMIKMPSGKYLAFAASEWLICNSPADVVCAIRRVASTETVRVINYCIDSPGPSLDRYLAYVGPHLTPEISQFTISHHQKLDALLYGACNGWIYPLPCVKAKTVTATVYELDPSPDDCISAVRASATSRV